MLVKQPIQINFARGLDNKNDPFQLDVGTFLALENSVFTTGKRLTKRNGYGPLASLPFAATYLTTFNTDLTAVGTSIEAYSTSNKSWINKGTLQPLTLSTLPLIRNSVNQTQSDSVVSTNGLVCTVYTETTGNAVTYKYAVADAVTGQNIIAPTAISGAAATYGTPKVYLLGNYFVIVYSILVSASYHLVYIAVSTSNPASVTAQTTISTSYAPATSVAFDGYTFSNNLYLFWNGDSSSGIKSAYLSSLLVLSAIFNRDASNQATIMSVTADAQNSVIWASYYNSGTSTGYSMALSPSMGLLANFPTEIITTGTILNITSVAQNGTATVLYEVSNSSDGVPCNYIASVTVSQSTGTVSSAIVVIRSLGLASKAFVIGGVIYVYGVYSSSFQPTYFLVNGSTSTSAAPVVIEKLAYENGGGYFTTGLPAVTVSGSTFYVSYLYKDLISALSDANAAGTVTVGGIYSQTGINMATTTLGSQGLVTAEIGSNLNISGGYLIGYDGYLPVESGFHLFPDPIVVTTNASAVTPTATTTNGSPVLTAVSSLAGVGIGATVTGTAIPSNTTVIGFSGTTITLSANATGNHSAETITITGAVPVNSGGVFYQALYSWADNQGNIYRSAGSIPVSVVTSGTTTTNEIVIPTLRVTEKVANKVKIELYRYSATNQVWNEVTSVSVPVLNDTTIDSVTIYDAQSDAQIEGNAIIYTAGGVIEDTGAPASSAVTLFDDRLWLVDAEDPNLLWFSKQVIEATPVEMSDLLTLYVAPTLGATGPTGPMTALSAMDDKLIIFKQNASYYINGTGPDNTGANNQYSQPTFITSMVGCTNQKSIVFQPQGLMFEFASDAGNQIWILGRDLSTQYIGAPVEALTKNATVLSAIAVPGTNQVRFNLSSGITLMFDYFYGQWGTFSTSALSSTLYQDLHTYIGPNGAVFQETPGLYLDGTSPVLLSFTTSWINIAGIRGYQRAFRYFLLGQYLSPFKLQCSTAYNYNSAPSSFALIQPTNFNPTYGGVESNGQITTYGSDSPYGGQSNILNWRVNLKEQRCSSLQITLQEIYDPSFGVVAGAGFTLSGLTLIAAVKSGFKTIGSGHTVAST